MEAARLASRRRRGRASGRSGRGADTTAAAGTLCLRSGYGGRAVVTARSYDQVVTDRTTRRERAHTVHVRRSRPRIGRRVIEPAKATGVRHLRTIQREGQLARRISRSQSGFGWLSSTEGIASTIHKEQPRSSSAARHIVLEGPRLVGLGRVGHSHRIECPRKVNDRISGIASTGYVQLVVDHSKGRPSCRMRERYGPRQILPRIGHRIV